jgi:hypothetical protein
MKTRVFISYHKDHFLIRSDILQPIQTGCENAIKLYRGMWRDNIGDNISAANDRYCELSAQYWVWKNYEKAGNPDFVGFMHYRRHFMFDGWTGNPDWVWLPKSNVYFVPSVTPDYLAHFSDDLINETMKHTDVVVLKPYDVVHVDSASIRTQFAKLPKQNPKNFDLFIKAAKRLYPEYAQSIQKIEKGSVQYLCNMFVMKKELFFEYSDFCFSILQEVDRQVDHSAMDKDAARFLGYFGEFCLSIWIFEHLRRQDCRIKELNGAFVISDTAIIHPRWRYWYCRLLSKITFGKRRQDYILEKRRAKKLLKIVK